MSIFSYSCNIAVENCSLWYLAQLCIIKLNSYLNAIILLSLCHMRISVFWGHELKKVQLQERFTLMIHDSIGHLKNALHERLSVSSGILVWIEMLQLIAQHWKNASVQVWIQLYASPLRATWMMSVAMNFETVQRFSRAKRKSKRMINTRGTSFVLVT